MDKNTITSFTMTGDLTKYKYDPADDAIHISCIEGSIACWEELEADEEAREERIKLSKFRFAKNTDIKRDLMQEFQLELFWAFWRTDPAEYLSKTDFDFMVKILGLTYLEN